MKTTDYAGIDYGLGKTNIDPETGIRFGIQPIDETITEWIWESIEPHYVARCPKCGNDATSLEDIDVDTDDWEEEKYDCIEFGCESCEYLFGESAYGDEADSQTLNDDSYDAEVSSQNELVVTRSPYFTHVQFCSPCFPGGGYLSNYCPNGPKTYCLGPDYYRNEKPPFPIYDVKTGKQV